MVCKLKPNVSSIVSWMFFHCAKSDAQKKTSNQHLDQGNFNTSFRRKNFAVNYIIRRESVVISAALVSDE